MPTGEKVLSPPKVTATSKMIYLGPKFFINLKIIYFTRFKVLTFLHFSEIASDLRWDPISRDEVGNQFSRITELLQSRGLDFFWNQALLKNSSLIWSPLCISILKLSRTQLFRHSLDFHVFMIPRIFLSDFPNFYKLNRGDLISGDVFILPVKILPAE